MFGGLSGRSFGAKNLDGVAKSLELFGTVPKLTVDYMRCLCVAMLFLCLNNMLLCVNFINVCMLDILTCIVWKWHNTFHMHWGTLEQ